VATGGAIKEGGGEAEGGSTIDDKEKSKKEHKAEGKKRVCRKGEKCDEIQPIPFTEKEYTKNPENKREEERKQQQREIQQ